MDVALVGLYNIYLEHFKGRNNLEDLGASGVIILKYISSSYVIRMWTEYLWFVIGFSGKLNTIVILLVPYNVKIFMTSSATISFLRMASLCTYC